MSVDDGGAKLLADNDSSESFYDGAEEGTLDIPML